MTRSNLARSGFVAGLGTLAAAAHAEVPAAIATAMAGVATDVGVLGTALVVVAVAGIAFMVGIKYLKKAPKAA